MVMKAGSRYRLAFLVLSAVILLRVPVGARDQPAAQSLLEPTSQKEQFLLRADILDKPRPSSEAGRSWRVTLDDGKRRHDAAVETADGGDPSQRNYRFNVAAYELDKALGLDLVAPSVERLVNGRPSSVTWWVDDFGMAEVDRRRRGIEPPVPETWSRQMQAVRVFDELIANSYRDVNPPLYLNAVWDNLLITRDWSIWLVDHTGAFGISSHLRYPDSLMRCDRALLGKLRTLNREALQRTLGKYLSPEQLEALGARGELLVKHFEEQVARRGEGSVLYDLGPTR
jgi:hypothetical protein